MFNKHTFTTLTACLGLGLGLTQMSTAHAEPFLSDIHLPLNHYINGIYLRQGHCRFTREQNVLTIRSGRLHASEHCIFTVYFNGGDVLNLPVRPMPFHPIHFYLNQGRA